MQNGWCRDDMTDEQLTAIYNEANGITGRRLPITTERIFTAMRATHVAAFRDRYEKGVAAFHEAVAMEREAWAKRLAKQAKDIRAGEMPATTNGAASALENAADMMRSNV